MKFLKTKTTWSNMELGLIKLCLASMWISIGAYFHKSVEDYIPLFLVIFFATAVWTGYLWIKKMKS